MKHSHTTIIYITLCDQAAFCEMEKYRIVGSSITWKVPSPKR